jgi:antagonist of KipI
MPQLIVVRPGMLTTVQDLGRWGRQGAGVPVAGPMDAYSHRLANRLVGNRESAAAIEVTLIGPELEAEGEVVVAVAGADFTLRVDGEAVPTHRRFVLPSRSRLRFGPRKAGARAVLAVRGGLALDAVFGSRATSLISGIGPFGGRPLAAGDVLPVGDAGAPANPDSVIDAPPLDLPRGGARVRVIRGPHEVLFTHAAFDHLFSARFLITPSSNRMGYRLEGPVLQHSGKADILSDATPMGSLQVPASGQPIVLMADRQTTGGYPKIATVITADLPIAGQLAPGDWMEFAPCTREAAADALQRQRRRLEGQRP